MHTITFEEPDGRIGPTSRTVEFRENARTGAISVKTANGWVKVCTRVHASVSALEQLSRYLDDYGLLVVEHGMSPADARACRAWEREEWQSLCAMAYIEAYGDDM